MAELGLIGGLLLVASAVPTTSGGGPTAVQLLTRSPWFIALLLLCVASLSLVVADQVARARKLWSRADGAVPRRTAPFHHHEEMECPPGRRASRETVRVHGRLGVWGLPLFHAALLLAVAAGLTRLLCASEAVVDLFEGETLPAGTAGYAQLGHGRLAAAFAMPEPFTLERLEPRFYPSGALESFSASLLAGDGEPLTIGINSPLERGPRTLYLNPQMGPTALVIWSAAEGEEERQALLLRPADGGGFRTETEMTSGESVLFFAVEASRRALPDSVEVRVLREGALIGTGILRRGQRLDLPGGAWLQLADVRWWARFTGRLDPSRPLLYAAFSLGVGGVLLVYAVIRSESAVLWEPTDRGVRLTVLLRPARFAPLFSVRFARLVEEARAELRHHLEAEGAG